MNIADRRTRISGSIIVKDMTSTWTLTAKLEHIINTQGVPPKSPGPHIPVKTLVAALEDLLLGNLATGEGTLQVEVNDEK